jgi:hypothetical protein
MESIPNKQICSIRIMFQVKTDEQAIELKSKINAIVSDIEGVRFEFTLVPVPMRPVNGTQI